MTDRIWLSVPYAKKDAAKAAGARWDPDAKSWYAPHPHMAALARWESIPEVIPGEDRTFGSGLFVDMVPSTCWYTNVRSCVSRSDWDRIRLSIYRRAGNRCEACGASPNREAHIRMEAHERWHFDDANSVQSLRRLICLCSPCHEATHFGRAEIIGHAESATQQLMTVRGCTLAQALDHIDAARDVWSRRSNRDWHLDLSMLTNIGIKTKSDIPSPEDRHKQAFADLYTTR